MSDTKTNLNVTELDFFAIKENFKRFIQAQGRFTDYNFEGSGLSILMDLLAYNTHYSAIYANMVASEMFLDSAQRRDSIVSHAKSLGYVPSSTKSSKAIVSITFTGITQDSSETLPNRTEFRAEKDGTSYTFYTIEPHEIDTTDETATLEEIEIYEGTFKTISYLVDDNVPNQRFVIPDELADTEQVEIRVQASPTDSTGSSDVWTLPADYTILTGSDKVYFVQEGLGGKFEIYFGDGILGYKPETGSLVTITYLLTSGSDANDIGMNDAADDPSFTLNSSEYSGTVTVVSESAGGAARETPESIRRTAPKYWQSQDRAVTASDYEAIILNDYPYADSVTVWGGEDTDPPQYGKVFISIKPKTGYVITSNEKSYIRERILRKKNVVTVSPEIVDPDYTYLKLDILVLYDVKRTQMTSKEVENLTKLAAISHDVVYLDKFESDLHFSKLVNDIDMSDPAIVSNITRIKLQKRVSVREGEDGTYVVEFNNRIHLPAEGVGGNVVSDTFSYKDASNRVVTAWFEDDGNGDLILYTRVNDDKKVLKNDIGDVDYESGRVTISNFNPVATNGTKLKVDAVPEPSADILGTRNGLLKLDLSDASALKVRAFTNKAKMMAEV